MKAKKYIKIITINMGIVLIFPFFAFSEENAKLNVKIGTMNGVSIVIRNEVKPFYVYKYKNIMKQKLDFSCGSASVSTILNYYLGHPISEEEIIEGIFKIGNLQKIIERKGFSLLDIKKFLGSIGYKAEGYKLDLKGLVSLEKPAIVTIVIGNYKHFVVFRGVYKGRVFLADPALGNMIVSVDEFEKMWYENIALVVEVDDEKISDNFKIKKDEMIWVDNANIRDALFYKTLPIFKAPTEF